MNQQDISRIKQLLNLADAAADFEFVDIKLVTHFHSLREEMGLAKLLLLIQDYVRYKTQSRPNTEVSEISKQNKDQISVQWLWTHLYESPRTKNNRSWMSTLWLIRYRADMNACRANDICWQIPSLW